MASGGDDAGGWDDEGWGEEADGWGEEAGCGWAEGCDDASECDELDTTELEFLAGATGAELGPAARGGGAAPRLLGFDDGDSLEFDFEGFSSDEGGDAGEGGEGADGAHGADGADGGGTAEAAEQARPPIAARLSGGKRPREAGELGA